MGLIVLAKQMYFANRLIYISNAENKRELLFKIIYFSFINEILKLICKQSGSTRGKIIA